MAQICAHLPKKEKQKSKLYLEGAISQWMVLVEKMV